MRKFRTAALLLVLAALTVATFGAASALASPDTRVTNGSPTGSFPQNKQNEPADAIDAHMPNVVAAGSNDEIDLQPCPLAAPAGTRCPFTQGVGVSGVYFSFDGGQSWMQPTYTGYTARLCTATACTLSSPPTPASTGVAGIGPIGTLPGTSRTDWSPTATHPSRSGRRRQPTGRSTAYIRGRTARVSTTPI